MSAGHRTARTSFIRSRIANSAGLISLLEIEHLFREESKAWVGVTDEPKWLRDGSFLWISERSGWKHVYHYSTDGNSFCGP